ncbi:LPXTG cell wall anchor domain-containing protein [Streptomyces sp. NBC_01276]|uniref:LPXTG cell wall anchor domain-containing protein n=1 Tax=Streptomyces sp. NBC_01276 TaxID=2903808 RepID=UPI00352E7A35
MSAPRPLLTALGATTLLAALWFVPSANATAPGHPAGSSGAPAAANTGTVTAADTGTVTAADTGTVTSTDTGTDTGAGVGTGTTGTGTGSLAGVSEAEPASVVTLSLADTGSTDTTPYVVGGTLCLGLGAGFVAFSVRRSRSL